MKLWDKPSMMTCVHHSQHSWTPSVIPWWCKEICGTFCLQGLQRGKGCMRFPSLGVLSCTEWHLEHTQRGWEQGYSSEISWAFLSMVAHPCSSSTCQVVLKLLISIPTYILMFCFSSHFTLFYSSVILWLICIIVWNVSIFKIFF